MIGILLGLATAVAYGASDFVGGLASRHAPALQVVLISYPLSALMIAILAVLHGGEPTAASLLMGGASGLAMALATWWLYIALAAGPMSLVSPLTSVSMTSATVIIGLLLGEQVSWLGYLAVAGGGAAVVLVSIELPSRCSPLKGLTCKGSQRIRPVVALYSIGAGVAFAVSLLFIHQVGTAPGLYPLVAARVAATLVVVVLALVTGRLVSPRNAPARLAMVVAGLDVVANIAMLYALQDGLLTVVSVVISLHPAITVILAVALLREGLRRSQVLGLGIALISVATISAAG